MFGALLPDHFLWFMCLFVACFKVKYVSGVSVDVNGIAAGAGPAILWPRETPASMDDCLGRLDWSSRLRSHQSHCSNETERLGPGNSPRTSVRVWRLVTLCITDAGSLRRFQEVASHTST